MTGSLLKLTCDVPTSSHGQYQFDFLCGNQIMTGASGNQNSYTLSPEQAKKNCTYKCKAKINNGQHESVEHPVTVSGKTDAFISIFQPYLLFTPTC